MSNVVDDLESSLWAVVEAEGAILAGDGEQGLRELIRKAALHIVHSTDQDGGNIGEAQENLRKVLYAMREEATKRDLNQLDLNSLREALTKLCPIWPFCPQS